MTGSQRGGQVRRISIITVGRPPCSANGEARLRMAQTAPTNPACR